MKLIFDTTAAAGPNFCNINFVAETEFEQVWLKAWAKNKDTFNLEWNYPNYEPKALNNPVLCLRITESKK